MARNNRQKESIRNRIANRARDTYEKARDSAEYYKEETEDIIKKHPLSSMAVVAGVSALVGAAVALGVSSYVSHHQQRSFWDKISNWF